MTSLHTLPIPRPDVATHEHAWLVESRHPTSEGDLLYVRCVECDSRRVDLRSHPVLPPEALSRPVEGAPTRR